MNGYEAHRNIRSDCSMPDSRGTAFVWDILAQAQHQDRLPGRELAPAHQKQQVVAAGRLSGPPIAWWRCNRVGQS